MIAFNGLQVNQTANGQPPFIALTLINHSVDMLG